MRLRHLMFGSPIASWRAVHERLPKILALPVLASNALSSVAYSGEQMLLILLVAGTAAIYSPSLLYLTAAIVILLAILVASYRQTIVAYPQGGGAYTVAKESLGVWYGLIAGAALATSYTLTVSVSVAAGVDALISAFPDVADQRILLGVIGIALLALANLRGSRESGLLFAIPTYLFVGSLSAMIIIGIYRAHTTGLIATTHDLTLAPIQGFTLILILRAFSGGCTIMTGTEAISNSVPVFKQPETRNAVSTLTIMGVILGVLFIGTNYLFWKTGAVPVPDQTLLSQLARSVFGTSTMFYITQFATVLILVLAANTSYFSFPRLASIMARDRYLPRQLYNVGDRLVFSNGIVLLSGMAALTIYVFNGHTHSMIPLYASVVFLSFTLSQAGMVKRFIRMKDEGWRRRATMSTIGALTTSLVMITVIVTRFTAGAWMVIFVVLALVYLFVKIHDHYIQLGDQLRLTADDTIHTRNNTAIVLTPSLHRGILPALEYARGLSGEVRALHIETDPVDTKLLEERWDKYSGGLPLVILESPYRSLVGPLLEYLEEVKKERKNTLVTVVIPEFVPAKWWHKILHNQSGLVIKFVLLFKRDIITTNVRYYLDR